MSFTDFPFRSDSATKLNRPDINDYARGASLLISSISIWAASERPSGFGNRPSSF